MNLAVLIHDVMSATGHPHSLIKVLISDSHNSGVLGSIPGLATFSIVATHKGNNLLSFLVSFLLLLFQEGQLSVTGESMCTKYWLTA